MEKETDQENQMVQIWCGCVQFCLWKNQGMCWQGMMHLGTLEVSLKVFDEELCWGFSRVCGDCQMIVRWERSKHMALFNRAYWVYIISAKYWIVRISWLTMILPLYIGCLWQDNFFNTIFVSSHMYPENPYSTEIHIPRKFQSCLQIQSSML